MMISGTVTQSFLVETVVPAVAETMDDSVEVVEVLPYEVSDAGVVGDCLVGAVFVFVSSRHFRLVLQRLQLIVG